MECPALGLLSAEVDDTTRIMRAIGAQLCKDWRGGVRSFASPMRCTKPDWSACTPLYGGGDATNLPRYIDVARQAAGGEPCVQPSGPCPKRPMVQFEVHAPRIVGDSASVIVTTFPANMRTEKTFDFEEFTYVVRRMSPIAWMVTSRHFTRRGHYEIPE